MPANTLFTKIRDAEHLQLIGLHAHIGSQIFELDPHRDLGEIMVKTILDAKKFGHNIEELNVGGGLGIRYTESDDPPSIDEWVKTIFSFGTPPLRAVNSSPSETASSPKFSDDTRLLMKIELFAFEAYIGSDSPG